MTSCTTTTSPRWIAGLIPPGDSDKYHGRGCVVLPEVRKSQGRWPLPAVQCLRCDYFQAPASGFDLCFAEQQPVGVGLAAAAPGGVQQGCHCAGFLAEHGDDTDVPLGCFPGGWSLDGALWPGRGPDCGIVADRGTGDIDGAASAVLHALVALMGMGGSVHAPTPVSWRELGPVFGRAGLGAGRLVTDGAAGDVDCP
jgi:hypothetical protein